MGTQWLRMGVEGGSAQAMTALAQHYLQQDTSGEQQAQAQAQAMEWLGKAAALGRRDAALMYGSFLIDSGDETGGVRWMRRAQQLGHPMAAQALEQYGH